MKEFEMFFLRIFIFLLVLFLLFSELLYSGLDEIYFFRGLVFDVRIEFFVYIC